MLTSRTALVTGGNRGIGYATAAELVARGHRVAVMTRAGEGPKGTVTVHADVRSPESVDDAFKKVEDSLGPVEILVANAGITRDALFLRMTEQQFDDVLETNLKGAFLVARRAAKAMVRTRYGRIVLISSVVALSGSPGQVNYSASKSGLVGMARSLTRELANRGITTNVIAPGYVDTAMTAVLPEALKSTYRQAVPVGRFATPEEIAKVVAWVAGEDAAYISGAVIPVDGGIGMGH